VSSVESQTIGSYLAERGGFSARIGRRGRPLAVSAVFLLLGLLYTFQWGPVVQHTPSLWLWPGDLWGAYLTTSEAVRGHVSSIYQATGILEFPGLLVALAPFGALSSALHTTFVQILTTSGQAPVIPVTHVGSGLIGRPVFLTTGGTFVADPKWVTIVVPYCLILSCGALFAFDALAERMQVSRQKRTLLCVTEALLLWNVTVIWGHPEDAVAIALAVYALIFTLDSRFVGAGWLFGVAVAFQPLVLLMLPVLLAVAGRQKAPSLILRSVVPSAVLLAVPLAANFHATTHAFLDQPNFPNLNHATPWTAISPHLGGQGSNLMVAGGPGRLIAISLAVGLGFWAYRHWRERPELLVLACAVALALRSYTESVLDAYYPWAALAVGLVVAATCSRWRFGIAIVLGVAATVIAQWKLGWLPWWIVQIVGLTALLTLASLEQLVWAKPALERSATRRPGTPQARPKPAGAKKASTGRAQVRDPQQARSKARSATTKKPATPGRGPSGRR
jgi:hypothetical protein